MGRTTSRRENFKFTPSKAPKTTYKNGKIFVHTHTNYTHPGDKAHGGFAKTVTLLFDNDFKFNTTAIPQVRRGRSRAERR